MLPSTHSDQDLANVFSNFLVEKIKNIHNFFPPVSAILSQTQPHNDPHCRLSMFEPTCVTEIKELIMKSASKSCELDPVPTSLIKNRSLSSGCFPEETQFGQGSFQELPTGSEFKVPWKNNLASCFITDFLPCSCL